MYTQHSRHEMRLRRAQSEAISAYQAATSAVEAWAKAATFCLTSQLTSLALLPASPSVGMRGRVVNSYLKT